MRYRWILQDHPSDAPRFDQGMKGVPRVMARCLELRGVRDAEHLTRFLDPRLQDLTDPFDFPDMRRVVDRLERVRARQERLVLLGDYDVDGVTATALLQEVLTDLGWDVSCYLPDRFDDGYGLTVESVRRGLNGQSSGLILAVDCGVGAAELIAVLAEQGIEVLVLDHHEPGAGGWPLTPCLHPGTLLGREHPAKDLCSVGCAFKLAHALVKEGRRRGWEGAEGFDVRSLLDLVALGTVADLVPLRGENRILVTKGMQRLEEGRRVGLRALTAVAGLERGIGVYEIGYQLAPRLNAAGRLDTARTAWDLVLTREEREARRLAEILDAKNQERQTLDRATSEAVRQRLSGSFDPQRDRVIVEGDPEWHLGVLGIVAARLVREFQRPALILGGGGEVLRGSGRSIEGFDLAWALGQCGDLLVSGGGHAMAAGLSVVPERLDRLRERLNTLAWELIPPEGLVPELRLDLEVLLGDLTVELMQWLQRLEPTGQGNPRPRFAVCGLRLAGRPQRMGRERQHLRFQVTDGGVVLPVVWWGGAEEEWPDGVFDLAVEPSLNHYQGRTTVQLQLLDWASGRSLGRSG